MQSMQIANRFQNALRQGGATFGAWQMLPGTNISRAIARSGFDWVCVDTEHGNISDDNMHECVAAIAACGVSPIVRVAANEAWMVKRALDAGAHGIIVPLLKTADDARNIVSSAKFPPDGTRGFGSPFSMEKFYTAQKANQGLVTVVQIETKEALKNVDEIASVPGVDVLLIGPFDLGNNIGYPIIDSMHDEVKAAITKIHESAKKAGKRTGIYYTSNPTTTPPQAPSRSRLRTFFLSLLFLAAGVTMAAAPAAPTVSGLVTPPSDEATLGLYQPTTPHSSEIDNHILSHPLSVSLRSDPNFTESRPHMKIPPAMRPQNLTGGTLLGADKIEVPPLVFQDTASALPTLVSLSYLGPALCGHPGIVHGGLLATLLDEGLARACFPALPNKVGVTASLKIDYRSPCPAGSYVVLRAETTKVEGRKAWVKGWIELLGEGTEPGRKLVEAEALFIEPKGAAGMPKLYSGDGKKKGEVEVNGATA
ncbi:Hypothetical protein D9617_21g097980 [Elsinoe fawcettii]|nr:Hypothetical protein D9617_21g097980 [Elsinoe fawcettii]